jgi:hypothetical protein
MLRVTTFAIAVLVLLATAAHAFEAQGTIRKVDVANHTLVVQAGGEERTVQIADDVKLLDDRGEPLPDGLKSKRLSEGAEAILTLERVGGQPVITAIQLGRRNAAAPPPANGKESVGLKPLNEMSAADKYKGEDGGLYGEGRNEPPAAHRAAAKRATENIKPLDADGRPAADGKIGLVSISMSNATQEFSYFKQLADNDPARSPGVAIVDCAQGGQAMAQWVDPNARAWIEADRRLAAAGVSPNQIQVAWIKLANVSPSGDLAEHGRKLQRDTLAVLHNAKVRFPNLQIAYLGSRIYGGYATTKLNPEPYAYEGAFAVRWLIQDQIKGSADLNYDASKGPMTSPLLLWGPYFWADGTTPRKSDGLLWERKDLGGDGTHPSDSGREKVAKMLLEFFKTDPDAANWFTKHP